MTPKVALVTLLGLAALSARADSFYDPTAWITQAMAYYPTGYMVTVGPTQEGLIPPFSGVVQQNACDLQGCTPVSDSPQTIHQGTLDIGVGYEDYQTTTEVITFSKAIYAIGGTMTMDGVNYGLMVNGEAVPTTLSPDGSPSGPFFSGFWGLAEDQPITTLTIQLGQGEDLAGDPNNPQQWAYQQAQWNNLEVWVDPPPMGTAPEPKTIMLLVVGLALVVLSQIRRSLRQT